MKRKNGSKAAALLLCAVVLAGVVSACSSGSGSSFAAQTAAPRSNAVAAGSVAMDQKSPALGESAQADGATAEAPTAAAAASLATQKIIERLSYTIETLKFDESVSRIQSLSGELGGYVQDSNTMGSGIRNQGSLRQASYTLRVPQEKLSQLKSRVTDIGSILNFSSSSENVSEKYYDTEARLKSLRTQQERLLALLQKSGTLTDIIALEKALADVNYQIEQLTGSLRQYDSLINFSTVSIQLNEVVKPTEIESTPVTLGDKIARQFQNSLKGLGSFGEGILVFVLGGAPILLILAVVAVALYWILLGRKKRAAKKAIIPPVPDPKEDTEPEEEHHEQ